MGNSTSTANSRPSGVPNRRLDDHSRSSHIPSPHSTHPSLRTKKKSLELPDLASLAFSSPQGSPYPASPRNGRHIPTSSPIPIPFASPATARSRPQNNFPSTQQLPDAIVAQPSTHIPIDPTRNPYIRGARMPYNSTHSFTSNIHQQQRTHDHRHEPPPFVPETVHSTIPIALTKAKQELIAEAAEENSTEQQQFLAKNNALPDDPKEPVPVKITWNGGGKSVILARAGDDNWKGRQPMSRENPPSDIIWSVWVNLQPGTHHLRFIVDGQWRVADDLPTAVDDEGTLANYVGVALYTPPSTSTVPPPPTPPKLQAGQSFWSTSSTGDGPSSWSDRSGPLRWTSDFPSELLAAAKEEEIYLITSATVPVSSSTSSVPAPNIPPAPTLPRHLDKLILNVKPSAVSPAVSRTRDREREREDRRSNARKARSTFGMTSATGAADAPDAASTTAPTVATRGSLDFTGLADDASVLPVPSHVVLQHLSTSAIRNGVLAVGNTTRYRKKYLTTIYYKPT